MQNKTKKYTVGIKEVHYSYIRVEAENPEDAKEKALELYEDGEEMGELEFSHYYEDTDSCLVNEIKE